MKIIHFIRGVPSWKRLAPLLIILAALLAYHNSFTGPLIFDDEPNIEMNGYIRHLWPLWDAMSRPFWFNHSDQYALSKRPIVSLTFAINYAIGHLNTFNYHVTNLVIHILAALTLFGLVRRTLIQKTFGGRYSNSAPWISLAAALIWTVHPLQTQAVTYIIQRCESLMGLFFLYTLYCLARSSQSAHPGKWQIRAVISCFLGVASKEVMITAPVMALIYDRFFLTDSFKEILKKRWRLYVGLFASWILIWLLFYQGFNYGQYAQTSFLIKSSNPKQTSLYHYAITQPGVILHYIRLVFWPNPLVLDYGWPFAKSIRNVIVPVSIFTGLLALTLWALLKRKPIGFLGVWFFLILVPTSFMFPINNAYFEHRMYLSLAAIVTLAVLTTYQFLLLLFERAGTSTLFAKSARVLSFRRKPESRPTGCRVEPGMTENETLYELSEPCTSSFWHKRIFIYFAIITVAGLGFLTYRRNLDYRSDTSIWTDAAYKRPENGRAYHNLATEFSAVKDYQNAIPLYWMSLKYDPDSEITHYYLGLVYNKIGKTEEAERHFKEAIRLNPDYVKAYVDLGNVRLNQDKIDEAISLYETALKKAPDFVLAHNSIGVAYLRKNQPDKAARHFMRATQIDDRYAVPFNNIGGVFLAQGKTNLAIQYFKEALELDPTYQSAQDNLRIALARKNKKMNDAEK